MKLRILPLLTAISLAAAPLCAEELVILHTNDTHSQLLPDDRDNLGGVARRKVLVDSVRAARPNVMLIDAGDAVQGTLFFNLFGGKVEQEVMNALNYDLRILGNHEFDNGVDSLAAVLAAADSKLLATNYVLTDSPLEGMFDKYALHEVGGRKIGFVAINLRPEGMISEGNYDNVAYLDALEAANASAWWLKHVEGADLVVAITHIGYDPEVPPGDVNLAENSSDIDIIIGGHSHDLIKPGAPSQIKNRQGRTVMVTQTGKGGKYLGEIVVDLDSLTSAYNLLRVDSRLDSRSDGSMEALLAPYIAGVDSLMRVPVARAAFELSDTENPALLNLCTDIVLERGRHLADNVDLALLNKGGIRRGLPKGTVTEGQVITMLPFDNRVQVIDIKGSDLLQAFRQMARVGGSGVSRGVKIEYSPKTATADAEIKSVTVNGEPLRADRTYRVATIDYLTAGGDYMPTLKNHTQVAASPDVLYKDVLRYLRATRRPLAPSKEYRMVAK